MSNVFFFSKTQILLGSRVHMYLHIFYTFDLITKNPTANKIGISINENLFAELHKFLLQLLQPFTLQDPILQPLTVVVVLENSRKNNLL